MSPLSEHGNKRKLPLQADVRHSHLIPAMTVLLWWSRAIERRPKFAQGHTSIDVDVDVEIEGKSYAIFGLFIYAPSL